MAIPLLTLNDGIKIPQLGYGLFQIDDERAENCVVQAVQTGYRLLDTAKIYRNEKGVGAGIDYALKNERLKREDLFVTTKLWNSDQGYDGAFKAFDDSMKLLGLDYLDLYLIHWPVPAKQFYVESWRALIELQAAGRVRSIGVCNFRIEDLEKVIDATGIVPAVNQIELHPTFQQKALRAFHQENHIATQAWSPLARGLNDILQNKVLKEIAKNHQRSVAQIILRWHIEIGNIVIPKTVSCARMQENFSLFDFCLSQAELAQIAALDEEDGRIGPNPSTFE